MSSENLGADQLSQQAHVQTLTEYWMGQFGAGADRPPQVLIATCELHWPGRKFRIEDEDEDRDEDDLYTIDDIVDVENGESALEIFNRERRHFNCMGVIPGRHKPAEILPAAI